MSRAVQQNFIQAQANGTVGAVFPGGVQIPTVSASSPQSSIRWVRQSDGSVVASIENLSVGLSSQNLDVQAGLAGNPANADSSVGLTAWDGYSDRAQIKVLADKNAGVNKTARVRATTLVGSVGQDRYILNGDGSSSFLQINDQFAGVLNYQVMLFQASYVAAAGTTSANILLPQPWGLSHIACFACLYSAPLGSWGATAAGVSGLNSIQLYMSGNPGVQTLSYYLLSIGNN